MLRFPPLPESSLYALRTIKGVFEVRKKSVLAIKGLDAIAFPSLSSLRPASGTPKEIYDKAGSLYWKHCAKEKLLHTSEVDVYLGENDLSLPLLAVVPPSFTKDPKDPVRLSDSYFHLFEACRTNEILSLGLSSLNRIPQEYPAHLAVPIAFRALSEWNLLYPDYPLNVVFAIEDPTEYAYYKAFVNRYVK